MRCALRLHPGSVCQAVTRIEVEVAREGDGTLVLHYAVTGQTDDLRLPPVTAPARVDELWRHTCFEAFVRASTGTAYYEFNFSPSTQWAAYRFDDYRNGMRVAAEIGAPRIEVKRRRDASHYALRWNWVELSDLPRGARRLGLSAVIEEVGGRKSYWALAHPPGKPGFPSCRWLCV